MMLALIISKFGLVRHLDTIQTNSLLDVKAGLKLYKSQSGVWG